MHPDGGKVIVSDRENNRAQVFDTATGKCTQVIASHRCVSVCVDKSTSNIFLAEQATHSSVQMGGYLGKVDAQREDLSGCEYLCPRARPPLHFLAEIQCLLPVLGNAWSYHRVDAARAASLRLIVPVLGLAFAGCNISL